MAGIKITGLDELERRLKKNATLGDVKKAVRTNGSQLQRKMQRNADFNGHMGWVKGKGRTFISPTGQTKRSIRLEIVNDGFTAEAGPTTEYAPYVEFGTRFMQSQSFVRPSLDEQKQAFFRDMEKLVK